MTQYQIGHVDGSWRVYATETGIDRTYLGPRCATPRDAAAWADFCAANPPLRSRAMDSPTGGVTALPPLAGVESIADAPRGRQGQSGG